MKNNNYKLYKSKRIYKMKTWVRFTSMTLLVCFIGQIIYPTTAFALTSGPQQPEASNFTPADVSNLVDPFTGDFSYNIPMFEIGGYPVNLSYASGITNDQEATWVGLGWNLNTGAITRDVRGIPDDFWGDPIRRDFHTKPNITAGGSVTVSGEFGGFDLTGGGSSTGGSASYGLQMKYNNYAGFSVGQTMGGGVQFPSGVNLGLGLSTTNGGLDINPNVSFSTQLGDKKNYNGSLGFGLNINSRTGLSQMSLNASISKSNGNSTTTKYGKNTKTSSEKITASGGGSIGFLNPTYTPQNNLPYQNFNFSGNFKIGGAVVFGDISGTIGGFYSEQSLMTNTKINPGFGYAYSEKGQYVSDATHDFNREKDAAFTNNTPSLPLTNYTYDAFSIKAQGIGGSFRGFRNDVGHVFDPEMMNPSVGGSFGMEVDLGSAVDIGVDINVNWNESKSGKWNDVNPAKDELRFREPQVNSLTENVFFKMVGEKVSESDNNYLNTIQTDKAVRVELESVPDPSTLSKLTTDNTTSPVSETTLNNNTQRNTRLIRNTSVQCFTVAEVKVGFPVYKKYLLPNVKDHHIGLIIVTTADGTRYVFGLPAYNHTKREVTFATGGNIEQTELPLNPVAGNLVNYAAVNASVKNPKGIDNYYDVTTTSPYVYTWYLTEVLSPDYSDMTGDGATADDLGGYVKFNYGIEIGGHNYPNLSNYAWRTPSTGTAYQATYSEGLKTIITDDKATYLFGTKDIWYPSSIESKTQLVKFEYSDRRDGFGVHAVPGVAVEHGPIGGGAQQKIEKINIYSRQDYALNSSSAVPLKTIHFEYDYSLCGLTPNNKGTTEIVNGSDINAEKGKLTLKKVYFTYRNSNKAKYSSYSFEYPGIGDPNNPHYDGTANDRWGTYRPNLTNTSNGFPKNEDYPYTLQDKATNAPPYYRNIADNLSKTWNLKAINLPTGGKINIEYESDDYAYVQNKKACHMFQVIGCADNSSPGSLTNQLYSDNPNAFGPPADHYKPNNYLFFTLEHSIPGATSITDANKIVKETYFSDPNYPEINGPTKFLYFRFLMNANKGNAAPANEYVGGYADIDLSDDNYAGVYSTGGNYTVGWVRLKNVAADGAPGELYNPISKAGWAFSRINTPFYANNQPVPGQSDPGDFIQTILNADVIAQLIDFFKGPNNKMRDRGFASKFVPNSSYIRLYDADGIKFGGGHRVKKITISDNWNNMESTESAFDYGQEYQYKTEDGKSSGVVSYEPMYGADENPFRIPVFYDKDYGPLIPDDRFYQEEPFGECFFPSPGIGYSRVKIMNLQRAGVTKTATGYTIKEFYTAKDFPTITRRTDMDVHRAKIDPILAIISPYVFDFMAASQGFSIELNDMHGKPKKESVYQEGNDTEPISTVNHFYKQEAFDETQINNNVLVMDKDGVLKQNEIGTEVDMVADFRENMSRSGNIDVGFNTDMAVTGPVFLFMLSIFPKLKFEDTRFRSASVTKVINRYAIEVKTEAFDLGSKVTTENMLFNSISGEPISTKVKNEFKDDRFTLSIPAYWAYPGMKHGSTNEGFILRATSNGTGTYTGWDRSNGEIILANAEDFLEPGDELIVTAPNPERLIVNPSPISNNYFNRVWVANHDQGTTNPADDQLYLINQYGNVYTACTTCTNTVDFKVVRSGHRNMLDPKIAEFATLKQPVSSGGFVPGQTYEINNSKNVLSVTGQTFNEQWKGMKRVENCLPYTVCECTPYQYSQDYLNMFIYILDNNIPFVNHDMLVYDGVSYYNGLTPAIVNQFLTTTGNCSTLVDVTSAKLRAAVGTGGTWYPSTDPGFLSGSPLAIEVYLYDSNGDSCTSCRPSPFRLISASSIPSDYGFPQPGIGCTGVTQEVMYAPISSIGTNMAIQLGPPITPGFGECGGAFLNCSTYVLVDHYGPDNLVNPYIVNILGKWRPNESYTLIEDRKGDFTAAVNIRDHGYINGYSDFWRINAGHWEFTGYDVNHWKRTTTMTQYHPSGPQIEEKNALDIFSAAQYGYLEQLAVAVVQNAQYKEIGFDGFEDYDYLDNTIPQYTSPYACTKLGHFRFKDVYDDNDNDIETTFAHTGKRCLRVTSMEHLTAPLQPATAYRTTRDVPYLMQSSDYTEFFGPQYGASAPKKFVFSFWAKQSNYSPVMFDYTALSGDIKINGVSAITVGSLKKSPIIDGWQKFEYTFDVAASLSATSNIEVILQTSGVLGYFDDVRIHPFNSMMKSYVYNPLDLRFMSELDENNYATFYEYDEDGALIRVKKETERGIMTIQENRYGSYKQ